MARFTVIFETVVPEVTWETIPNTQIVYKIKLLSCLFFLYINCNRPSIICKSSIVLSHFVFRSQHLLATCFFLLTALVSSLFNKSNWSLWWTNCSARPKYEDMSSETNPNGDCSWYILQHWILPLLNSSSLIFFQVIQFFVTLMVKSITKLPKI